MSPKSDSLRKNFLKTQIFHFEHDLKSRAAERVKEIDEILGEIKTIENRLKELVDFTDRDIILKNLDKYTFNLTLVRTNELEIYHYIDNYYKNGSPKPKIKTPRKKKTQP